VSDQISSNVNSRNEWLDVLRGIAILSVVAVHTIAYANSIVSFHGGEISDRFTSTLEFGIYGVELFFFLSGYLLASIYGFSSQPLMPTYWLRRAARIWPLWIVFLLFSIIRGEVGGGGGWSDIVNSSSGSTSLVQNPLIAIVMGLTFTLWVSGLLWNTLIPGGWSIQAEVAHYIVFPIIRRHSLSRILTVMGLINLATYFSNELIHSHLRGNFPSVVTNIILAWIRLNLFATFGYFLLGVVAYLTFEYYQKFGTVSGLSQRLRSNPFSIGLYSVSFLVAPLNGGPQIACLGCLTLFITFSYWVNHTQKIKKFFVLLGKYSYFVYFCHFQILAAIAAVLMRIESSFTFLFSQLFVFVSLITLVVATSLLFAVPSMKWIEMPILKMVRRRG
jgi:peptidoglycan/LPS O-acetylase OafA/YrhL